MRRPNVIVFFTDQQRWDTSGLHGNPLDLTPNFDAMAQAGTHLAQTFTCQPVCGPARSCLQTGMYATETGCWRNGIQLNPELRTLAHFFGLPAMTLPISANGTWGCLEKKGPCLQPLVAGMTIGWLPIPWSSLRMPTAVSCMTTTIRL